MPLRGSWCGHCVPLDPKVNQTVLASCDLRRDIQSVGHELAAMPLEDNRDAFEEASYDADGVRVTAKAKLTATL